MELSSFQNRYLTTLNTNLNPCIMKKTKSKKAVSPKKSKATANKKNQKSTLKVKTMKSRKTAYPSWTMPKHLSERDHKQLKRFYELFTQGRFDVALNFASGLDTIVREEIPSDIWEKTGGKLTKKGKEQLKNTTEKSKTAPSKPVCSEKDELPTEEEKTKQKPQKEAKADFSAFVIKDDTLQPFSTEHFNADNSPVEKKFQSEKEFEQLILTNSRMLFGQHALIIEDKEKKDEYFPDKFLFDFSDNEKPRFYIIETVLSAKNFGYFYARITHFLALLKIQSRQSGFHERLCEIIDADKAQKKELQTLIGSNRDVSEFLSVIIGNKPVILLVMDNLRDDLPLLQETYTDTWGKMVKSLVLKKYSSSGNTIYTMRPDFADIWKNEKGKKEGVIKCTEADHLDELPERIRNIYNDIKTALLETDSSLEFNPKKHYISIRKNKNLAFLHLRRKNMDIVVMNLEDDTRKRIKHHRIKTLPASVQKFWNGACCTVVIENADNLDEVIDLLKMVVAKA